ncbi:cupin domain-containing protein [Tenacibaculum sp. M341]|uniref:cupin domain-containing protein n=1 Tax=Tenacibaculum sp. M341 TaxID=2530339 RepID=UPI00104804CE|nr:cupin domain-containing protein [Tenacibaculum sp. M341]TCI91330.1 cupin domain-containing protein [Tenacibaculum sp. M341]
MKENNLFDEALIDNMKFSNPIIKDQIEILESSKHQLLFRTILAANGGQNQLHYHTAIKEIFKVRKGKLTVVVGDSKKVLTEGDEAIINSGVHHMFLNVSEEEAVFDVTVENPKRMIEGLQIMYGLASDGKINSKGLPKNIFHTVIALKMLDAFSPKYPFVIQKSIISLLSFLGTLFGVKKKLLDKYCLIKLT